MIDSKESNARCIALVAELRRTLHAHTDSLQPIDVVLVTGIVLCDLLAETFVEQCARHRDDWDRKQFIRETFDAMPIDGAIDYALDSARRGQLRYIDQRDKS